MWECVKSTESDSAFEQVIHVNISLRSIGAMAFKYYLAGHESFIFDLTHTTYM